MNISSGRVGKTIYLGKRKSNTSIRIYDKLAEREVKGEQLPEDLKHWVRFELEFHNNNAGAVFSKFLDCENVSDFASYVSRVSFDLIRFVDNCTVCDWWMMFLGSLANKGMYIKLSTNQYLHLRSVKYAKVALAAMLAGIFTCDEQEFRSILEEGKHKKSKTKSRIISDFKLYQGLSPGY